MVKYLLKINKSCYITISVKISTYRPSKMTSKYNVWTRSMARNIMASAQTDTDSKDDILPIVGTAPAEA